MAATQSSKKMKMVLEKTYGSHNDEGELRREASNDEEGYHGDESRASVPFRWESQPGTPKHRFHETTLIPPLTPPPSYYSHPSPSTPRSNLNKPYNNKNRRNFSVSNKSSNNLLRSMLPRTPRKARAPSPPPPALSFSSTSSSSSSSYSSCQSCQGSRSLPSTPVRRRPRKEKKEDDEEDVYDAHGSGLCFGNAAFRGCYSSMVNKLMLRDFL